MVRKRGAKLEICLIEGELRERANAEGWRSRHRGRRTDGQTRRVDAEGRMVELSLLSPLPLGLRRQTASFSS